METTVDIATVETPDLGLGRMPDVADERDWRARSFVAPQEATGLVRVDWTNRLGPVLNQGNSPHCVAYTASALKTYQERREHRRTYLFDAPAAYRLCKIQDGDSNDGTFARTICKVMQDQGYGRQGHAWDADALRWRIEAYARIRGISELENALATLGPCMLGVSWYKEWFWPERAVNKFVLSSPASPSRSDAGGHEILLVGFDRSGTRFNEPVFTIRNSWGAEWGDKGNAYLTYAELERQLDLPESRAADIWSVVDATRVAKAVLAGKIDPAVVSPGVQAIVEGVR